MKFSVLASSSGGNCIYIESNGTRVLVDAGTTHKNIKGKLSEIGVELGSIDAICLTHDHSDHVAALPVIQKHYNMPLFATGGTSEAVDLMYAGRGRPFEWNVFEPGMAFEVGSLRFEAFAVPHDAGDPVGYVVSDGESRLGIATDMGEAPEVVAHHLRGCTGLILEFNHDVDLLQNSDRPWSLKQRIRGRKGHLSNEQACELLARVASESLRALFLAHISEECNDMGIARRSAEEALSSCGLNGSTRICLPSWPFPPIDI